MNRRTIKNRTEVKNRVYIGTLWGDNQKFCENRRLGRLEQKSKVDKPSLFLV